MMIKASLVLQLWNPGSPVAHQWDLEGSEGVSDRPGRGGRCQADDGRNGSLRAAAWTNGSRIMEVGGSID